ncbi:cytochrome b/b6 domain-containing protein [Peteryoungia desertarenae]|uniref:Cytochrome b/b6 domain-containing protein n=1 Tax=Peteryoungia desertarenae TaxID=1813451 RepID=A0ABX6QK81_9HYPH|nr:cytochrome b/b6 domain-containing protein [Peteryoungia desertarenae]QLF68655.1 cytochrome b/b6 domain-containing protein [Peteryoungia desertarenae]
MAVAPTSFSIPQKALHWLMALLILFNLIFAEAMEEVAEAYERGEVPSAEDLTFANIHAYVGIAVLCLGIVRLALRLKQGAPLAPVEEPAIAQLAAKVAHGSFYVLFFLLPLSGIGAYYFANETAGFVHGGPLKSLMWLLIAAHIAALVVHQFYWKSPVAGRMTRG